MDASASRRFRDNLTFSSTLLDEIYRSIDEQSTVCSETTRKKQSKSVGSDSDKSRNRCFNNDDDRRACLYQKWTENKACEKPVVGRSSATDLDKRSMRCKRETFCVNSSPSSCDFSCGGGGGGGGVHVKPKPIRTGVYQHNEFTNREKQRIAYRHDDSQVKPKHEGKFVKTKSKALKIYNDLKKVKQPISPGGRLSTFLNSLFTTGNNKKSNTSTATAGDQMEAAMSQLRRKSTSQNASTCSSASSISRSFLTNTPSSRGNLINDVKKSVTFYPVSAIIDEESDSNSNKFSETARNLLKNYRKKVECEFDSVTNNEDEDENQSNDGRSDSSSDLFELNNLSPIHIQSHQQELPLYATTNLHNNIFM